VTTLLFFAQAREAAGTSRWSSDTATTVGEIVEQAKAHFGESLARIVPHCKIWCNGEPATSETPITANDEVALLPPVSGG
jgi:molybdopterin converting factor small subunit